ncbi:MAG: PolC-type DNA polymerase III [Alkaliphilus sp.]
MSGNKTMEFNSFLRELNIDSFLENDCVITHAKYYRESKKIEITLNSNTIIEFKNLESVSGLLQDSLQLNEKPKFSLKYDIAFSANKELIEINYKNIVFFFKESFPSLINEDSELDWQVDKNKLTINVNDNIIVQKARERGLLTKIEDYFSDAFDVKMECKIILAHASKMKLENHIKEKEKRADKIATEIAKENKQSTTTKPSNGSNNSNKTYNAIYRKNNATSNDKSVVIGKKISGEIYKIKYIEQDDHNIIIEGDVVSEETKTLNSGKKLYILNITDYTSTITVKLFERKKQRENIESYFAVGNCLRIRGEIVYDKFLRENIMMISDINIIEREERIDESDEKRIELHAHTKMSSMDGICGVKDLVRRAAKWGHKAIAITDHGGVQAFPDAASAGKKHGIKIIYGLEGYIVDDEETIVDCKNNYGLEEEFIIFDIETTGLSPLNNKITEIGAVKIKNSVIVETFSKLINPVDSIPAKIVELTGITDEMVKNSPRIEEVLPEFISFIGNAPLVAHNVEFDIGFIRENARRLDLTTDNMLLDTIKLAKVLMPGLKRHKLSTVAKKLGIKIGNHHRAFDDATATAKIFIRFIELMKEKEIYNVYDINDRLSRELDYKKLFTKHIVILAKNYVGLKNLYRLISTSHLDYFYKKPIIPKTVLDKHREGLILGSACVSGELYQSILRNKTESEIMNIAKYYDYLEIQPLDNNKYLIEKGAVKNLEDLIEINRKIISLGEQLDIPVVATGDVHFLDEKDEVFRRILMSGQGYSDAEDRSPLYLKTTNEMLKEFDYLGDDKSFEVVVENSCKINDMIMELIPVPNGTFTPQIEGSDDELREMCNAKAKRIYGEVLPEIVGERLDRELNSIISNGYAVMYIISQKLVAKSEENGYLVGSRGSVGSSFAATMSDITEVNPLPPHYICDKCKYSEFITDGSYSSGVDMPNKNCPKCENQLYKEGHDIPFEVFLGFEGDKEPDIDLNFAGEYQSEAHKYTEELFGKGKVFRAGTIGTIAQKTAYGFVRKYHDEKQIFVSNAEINRLTLGCTGVKRTSGQHPGGVMIVPKDNDIHEFTPIQYPANDPKSGVITTHFDYHSISGRLLKLDILGHDVPSMLRMLEDFINIKPTDIPLDDAKTLKLFDGIEVLEIEDKRFDVKVGTLGIPEFGTKFVRQMLLDTKPSTLAELIRISGLSHGTDVWLNNAQDLVREGTATLKNVISTRDDIMNYLIQMDLPAKSAFNIMENVRKGKGLSEDDVELMKKYKVAQWYIDSCNTIKYMFPKAHAAAYVMMSFRIAYCKIHHPEAFYATYFTTKAEAFDADFIIKGKEFIFPKIKEIEELGNKLTAKEKNTVNVLEVALEMLLRNITLLKVDLYKSDATKFLIVDGKLLPPLKTLEGLGHNVAIKIQEEAKKSEFISIEDIKQRTKATKTAIEALKIHGCLDGLSDTNQLSLF